MAQHSIEAGDLPDEDTPQPPPPTDDVNLDGDELQLPEGPLTEQQWIDQLTAAIHASTWINLAPGDALAADVAQGDQWPAERTIPANAIRAALLTRNLEPDPHGLRIIGARISGQLDLDNATIPCPLILGYCHFTHPLTARSSTIPQLTLTGSHTPDISLDGATITGGVSLTDGFTATGEIRALGASISGQLSLRGAKLSNPNGDALSLDRATITGSVFLTDGFTATGKIRAVGASISGQLSLRGAKLSNPNGDALSLDRATITGDVFLTDGFTATGEIRALGASISGQLSLRGAKLSNPNGDALSLDGATITGGVFLTGGFTAEGLLDLSYARIGVLVIARVPAGQLLATGWHLTDIHGPATEWKVAQAWLDTTPKNAPFAASAWHEVANVYDRQGRPSDAKRLRIAAANRVTRNTKGPAKALRILYGLFAGYGYWPLLAGVWLLIAAVIACLLVYQYGPVGTDAPPGFNPWLYGAAVVVPPAAAITPSTWTITSPLWLAWTLIGLKAFGWLQTAILLAGLTGLLKKS